MTYIDELGKITTKGEPDPVVNLECYRLVLYHEMSDGNRRIELEPPLQLNYILGPYGQVENRSKVLAEMMKKFEDQIIFKLGRD